MEVKIYLEEPSVSISLVNPATSLSIYNELLITLGKAFADAGKQLFLVGGSVRDALLGRVVNDLDFTTDALPEETRNILTTITKNIWEVGIAFGTISAQILDNTVEITTFRTDAYDHTSRNPEVSYGTDLAADLIRRDFTINAIALKITAEGIGELYDPLQGVEALKQGIIDTPQSPGTSFNDDPLRMLRAARFVSQLGFVLAKRVFVALTKQKEDIRRITAERIQAELNKLILGKFPTVGFEVLVDSGLAEIILPEIVAMRDTQDEHNRHKDVYRHSLQVLNQAIALETAPDLTLRWAALLHDIGKPATRKFEENNKVSFHHHEVVGAKLARKRLRELKYPKKFIAEVSQLIFLHLRFHGYGEQKWSDSAVRRYVNDAGDLLDRLNIIVRADCTTRNKRKSENLQHRYDELEERIKELAAKEDLAKIRPALDGNEIMQLLNLKGGPAVGKAWDYLKQQRIEQGEMSKTEATKVLLEWWGRQQ